MEDARRLSYDRIVADYDAYRPSYPAEVVQLLMRDYGLVASSRVLEIGCGTGQLTSLLMASGAKVDALDVSPEMVRFAEDKMGPGQVHFQAIAFEDFCGDAESYDGIVSATAFHWIQPEARVRGTCRLLKRGGFLAFMVNDLVKDSFHEGIETVYAEVLAMDRAEAPVNENPYPLIAAELADSGLFGPVQEFVFDNKVSYSADAYIGLSGTHSFPNTLDSTTRVKLFEGFRAVFERRGSEVDFTYLTRMYVCVKL